MRCCVCDGGYGGGSSHCWKLVSRCFVPGAKNHASVYFWINVDGGLEYTRPSPKMINGIFYNPLVFYPINQRLAMKSTLNTF